MNNKKPHAIMGQKVTGSAKQGYSLDIKFYESTEDNSYTPSAEDMLNELESDLNRLERLINARSRKPSAKLVG